MGKNTKKLDSDDKITFSKEAPTYTSASSAHKKPQKLKLLIVDDEQEVHVMTKLVLSDYHFHNYTLEFYSAYSAAEAKKLIKTHPDAACVLLDVVMESADAGLDLIHFIRKEEKNDKLRIILRTGQPGQAPENDIISNYDINDYKEKTELTSQKLFTTITTALRSYLHLMEIEEKTIEIKEKNEQLNDEIARRIVAESNLTKYNRSLEKMLENKSERLKIAIKALRQREKELEKSNQSAHIGKIASATLTSTDYSGQTLKDNLDTINAYRSDMTILLEKYETLHDIIARNSDLPGSFLNQTQATMDDIDNFKNDVDINSIQNKYPEIIQDSIKGIDHISEAISDIKLFISINNKNRETTDINELLNRVISALKSEFSQSIDLQIDFEKLPHISVGTNNIEKAFYEILKNAFEAVQPKGIINVSTTCNEPDIEIHVQDIGPGIERDHISKVFKPYFTVDKADKKGLGLTFAKSVITNDKGSIKLKSSTGKGTHVIITFPVPEPD